MEAGMSVQAQMVQSDAAQSQQQEEGGGVVQSPIAILKVKLDFINCLTGNVLQSFAFPLTKIEGMINLDQLAALLTGGKLNITDSFLQAMKEVYGSGPMQSGGGEGGDSGMQSDAQVAVLNTGHILHDNNAQYHDNAAVLGGGALHSDQRGSSQGYGEGASMG